MFSLVFLVFVGGFLLFAFIVVRLAQRYARWTDRDPKKWGWGAALILYLILAWEQIPTYLVHQFFCLTEVGYWVYKTPEQWKAEHPGIAETLEPNTTNLRRYSLVDHRGTGAILNQRFAEESRVEKFPLLPVRVIRDVVVDRETDEVMAESVTVSSGYGNPLVGGPSSWRFWVGAETCWPKGSKIRKVLQEFKHWNGREE